MFDGERRVAYFAADSVERTVATLSRDGWGSGFVLLKDLEALSSPVTAAR